ncbi:YggS family pyridoxal phosphate-dependent enzyme [Piscirickettsia litoralis]|uniref:Pyridoxal phosphate homeostasis protein n=1 Tax=Piscirickettsia litoralis TaxID=1891921 RepID=A0ABX3A3R6_9GAMM|nr:YggS family pyridoxal phosphate-dependent enzyme [Piscirickettsia litoralis]ODN43098.1 YggS family pyridoxal phosphate enzyme [Piscirickettsia litoralis]
MMNIADNLAGIHKRIELAMRKAGRMDRPKLIAVSKTKPVEMVNEALSAGQYDFGENYLQDALVKIDQLSKSNNKNKKIIWHFIGPLQSNKASQVAEKFDWLHTLDRLKIAQRLNDHRPEHLAPLKVCIQVNLANESTKSGIHPTKCLEFAEKIMLMPRLSLQGLMAIPKRLTSFDGQYEQFMQLRQLRDDLTRQGVGVPELSMGMSQDLEAAVCAGATMLRIGTDIFGARN